MDRQASSFKVALITGGNRGIGYHTARRLAEKGLTCVIVTRDQNKGERIAQALRRDGLDVRSIRCDVTNPSHRKDVHDYLAQNFGRLDVLINNAGVWLETANSSVVDIPNTTETLSEAMLRRTFEVNFFAPLLLTQMLLPLLREASAARIVNVSSLLGSHTLHADPTSLTYATKVFAYNASKAALNTLTTHLAHALRDTPMKVNSIHPGWVRSAMGGPGAAMDEDEGSLSSVKYATLPADGPTGGFFHMDETIPW